MSSPEYQGTLCPLSVGNQVLITLRSQLIMWQDRQQKSEVWVMKLPFKVIFILCVDSYLDLVSFSFFLKDFLKHLFFFFTVGPPVMNSFSFCMFEKVFILASHLKNVFGRYRILGWSVFLSVLYDGAPLSSPLIISYEKSAVMLILIPP